MFRRYTKNAAPAWQRRLILFLWGLFSATLLLFAAWAIVLLIDQARMDECNDRGLTVDEHSRECVSP